MNYELTEICTNKISEYLDFDVSKIFESGENLIGKIDQKLGEKEDRAQEAK